MKWLDITKTSTIKIEMEDARIRDDLPIFSLIFDVDDGIKEILPFTPLCPHLI